MGAGKIRLAVVLGAVSSLVIAACGGGAEQAAPQPTTPPAATSAPAATTAPVAQPTATPRPTAAPAPTPTAVPVPTGEFTVTALTLSNFFLFPFPTNQGADQAVLDAMYDKVFEATPTGKFDFPPSFATSATASADSRVWTVKTRNGVVFQNGDPATSKDVAFALGLFTSKESQYSSGIDLGRVLTKTETPDDQTVVFTLSEPNIFFPQTYLSPIGNSVPHNLWPQKYVESIGYKEANKKPIGSGPYKFKSIIVGDRIVTEAVDKHWYYGVPRTKTLSFVQIPEENTRVALLKTGGSDFAPISEQSAAPLQTAGVRLFTGGYPLPLRIFPHRMHEPLPDGPNPLSNEDVRKAMFWYAIDRAALAAAFYPVSGKLSMDYPVHPADPAYDPNNKTPIPPYDPAKAKALLAQAGYPRGFDLDAYSWRPENAEPFEAIAVYWEQIGLKVKRIPILLPNFQALAIGAAKTPWKKATVSGLSFALEPIAGQNQPRNAHNPGSFPFTTDEPETLHRARAFSGAATLDDYIKAGREYQRYVSEHLTSWIYVGVTVAAVYAGSGKIPKDWQPGIKAHNNIFLAAVSR